MALYIASVHIYVHISANRCKKMFSFCMRSKNVATDCFLEPCFLRQGTKVFKSLKGITSISDSEFWSPARDAVEEPPFFKRQIHAAEESFSTSIGSTQQDLKRRKRAQRKEL